MSRLAWLTIVAIVLLVVVWWSWPSRYEGTWVITPEFLERMQIPPRKGQVIGMLIESDKMMGLCVMAGRSFMEFYDMSVDSGKATVKYLETLNDQGKKFKADKPLFLDSAEYQIKCTKNYLMFIRNDTIKLHLWRT